MSFFCTDCNQPCTVCGGARVMDYVGEREAENCPFIEYGAGWAKIHFRRDVTEQDRANLSAALALSSNKGNTE
jgi:hypothetical protein